MHLLKQLARAEAVYFKAGCKAALHQAYYRTANLAQAGRQVRLVPHAPAAVCARLTSLFFFWQMEGAQSAHFLQALQVRPLAHLR